VSSVFTFILFFAGVEISVFSSPAETDTHPAKTKLMVANEQLHSQSLAAVPILDSRGIMFSK
jgi:hypothetical protein